MACSQGDILSRVITPLVFMAARAAIAEAGNEYRRSIRRPSKRPRRSRQQELAVSAIVSFLDPQQAARAVFALNRTIIDRGAGKFGESTLSEAHEHLADLGIFRVIRDGRDGRANAKRLRVFDPDAVMALLAGLPYSHVAVAAKAVWRLACARSAFATAADLATFVSTSREAWRSPRSAVVGELIDDCAVAEVEIEWSKRARQPKTGAVDCRRIAALGRRIDGWDDVSSTPDLAPYRETHTPSISDEIGNEKGRLARACGAEDCSGDESSSRQLTRHEKSEQDTTVTKAHGDTDMTNLTGRPVMTKEDQAATDRLRRQGAKAARSKETTSRALGDVVSVTGPSETCIMTMRKALAETLKGQDTSLFDQFLLKMQSYSWRGKTQKAVDDQTMLWFQERLQGGSLAPKAMERTETVVDLRYAYRDLCGNDQTHLWSEAITRAGLERYENTAMLSAERIAFAFGQTGASKPEAWDGMKRMCSAVASCAYMFHVAGMHENADDSLTIEVLHANADVGGTEFAQQPFVDKVAAVISAISGRRIIGVPAKQAWVGISQRAYTNTKPF